jgi:WD40 repeat protein
MRDNQEMTGPMLILKGHTKAVYSLAFSADGRYLLTGSGDETARLWDMSNGTEAGQYHTRHYSVLHALFVPNRDPMQVLLGTGNVNWVWEPVSGRVESFSPSGLDALAFAPDRAYLAGLSGGVRRWDLETQQGLDTWNAKPDPGRCLGFSADGTLLATGCADGTVILWNARTGIKIGSLGRPVQTQATSPAALDHFIAHVAFAGSSRLLVTATSQTLAVWDTTTHQRLATHRHKGKHYQGIAVSPDGRLLATANNDTTVRFQLLPGLEERAAFTWKVGPVLSIAFAPDGFRCAAGGRSGKVVVWDVDE